MLGLSHVLGVVHVLNACAAGGLSGAAPGSSERLLAAAVPAFHGERRGGPCSGGFEAGKRVGFGCWGGGDTPRLGGLAWEGREVAGRCRPSFSSVLAMAARLQAMREGGFGGLRGAG